MLHLSFLILVLSAICVVCINSQWFGFDQGTNYNDAFNFGNSGFSAQSPFGSINNANSFGNGLRDFDQYSSVGSGMSGRGFAGGFGGMTPSYASFGGLGMPGSSTPFGGMGGNYGLLGGSRYLRGHKVTLPVIELP